MDLSSTGQPGRGQAPIHFKEETISLCHPERSEGSLSGERSFAALRMTLLHRLRLTRKTSYLKCIGHKGPHPTQLHSRPYATLTIFLFLHPSLDAYGAKPSAPPLDTSVKALPCI